MCRYSRKSTRARFVITLSDVSDIKPSAMQCDEGVIFDVGDDEEAGVGSGTQPTNQTGENKVQTTEEDKETGRSQALAHQPADRTDYQSTDDSPEGVVGREWSFHTPAPSHGEDGTSYFEGKAVPTPQNEEEVMPIPTRSRSGSRLPRRRTSRTPRPRSSVYAEQRLPRVVGRPLSAWLDRVGMLFTPQWKLTTILIWLIWWGISLGRLCFVSV
jgi:hypothetical protein